MVAKRKLGAVDDIVQENRPKRVLRSAKIPTYGINGDQESSDLSPRTVTKPKSKVQGNAVKTKPKAKIKTPVDIDASIVNRPAEEAFQPDTRTLPPRPITNKVSTRSYWLMKAEPNTRLEKGIDIRFSIDDLASKTSPEPWDGIRNHVAKNHLLAMKKGDIAFFYHSNCKVPGIVGLMEIVDEAKPDPVQWDFHSPYFDAKSTREKPRWFAPFVEFRYKFGKILSLEDLKGLRDEGRLKEMELLRLGRLSVSKVREEEFRIIMGIIMERNEDEGLDDFL